MSDNKKILIFSIITGDIFTIEEDEYKNMDRHHVPLLKRPSSSCKKCYGRFHEGINTATKLYVLCRSCTNKCVDFKRMVDNDIQVETIKHA